MLAGEVLRDGSQLQPVVRDLHGLPRVGIDPGPGRMAVLPAILDVKDNGVGLTDRE